MFNLLYVFSYKVMFLLYFHSFIIFFNAMNIMNVLYILLIVK